jgi:hypothetical protein
MPNQTTPTRIQNVGLLGLLALFLVGIALAGCGGSKNAGAQTAEDHKLAAESNPALHKAVEATEACEGMRIATLTWARAMKKVVETYGTSAMYPLATKADEDSFRLEEANKKMESLLPSAAVAVARYNSTVAQARRAIGEGVQTLAGVVSEVSAVSESLKTLCETR